MLFQYNFDINHKNVFFRQLKLCSMSLKIRVLVKPWSLLLVVCFLIFREGHICINIMHTYLQLFKRNRIVYLLNIFDIIHNSLPKSSVHMHWNWVGNYETVVIMKKFFKSIMVTLYLCLVVSFKSICSSVHFAFGFA